MTGAIEIAFKRLDERIAREVGDLRTEMHVGFAQVDRPLARLDDRVSTLEHRVGGLEDDVSRLKTRLRIID